jgi:DNA-binding transcriptional ArsR family regulator
MPMQTAFEALAEPHRRHILDLLCEEEWTVGELVAHLSLCQPAVSKHLRMPREAGLVSVRVDAQRRRYRLRPAKPAEIDDWLAPYWQFWDERLEALKEYLEHETKEEP